MPFALGEITHALPPAIGVFPRSGALVSRFTTHRETDDHAKARFTAARLRVRQDLLLNRRVIVFDLPKQRISATYEQV